MRILIAEDDQELAEIIRAVVLTWRPDAQISLTPNGEMALWAVENSAAQGKKFHLIISDWSMPRLTGLEFLRKVRSSPTLSRLPFIMLTALSSKDQVVEAIKAGVTGYVTKPLRHDTLINKLNAAVSTT